MPLGLHARPIAFLCTIQKDYFPKDDIILVNLATKAEAPINVLGLFGLAAKEGHEIEFLAVMDDDSFGQFERIVLTLSYIPTVDSSGRSDWDYTPCFPLSHCKPNRTALITKLAEEAAGPGRQPMFVRLDQPKPQAPITPQVTPITAPPEHTQIFVSYSYSDLAFVKQTLVPLFRRAGYRPWYSLDSIRGADRWERSILEGLQQSEWFAVAMSPHASASDWVRLEVHWASEHRQGKIIPIMIADCDPWQLHMGIGSLQYIDFRRQPDEAANKLLTLLQNAT
jgi:phosphotransferase system HPr-like phosphotransfer protein